jgi:pimeloyl-ACP methyl ester carboxylesterase
MGEQVRVGNLDHWVERRGQGPEVPIIAGFGDPVEAWQFQLEELADRYRFTAYDNLGTGRTPMPDKPFTIASLADNAAALLRALEIPAAHVVSQSSGSVIAQELALRHPELVRSLVLVGTSARPDAYLRSTLGFFRWLAEVAPSERAFLEAFCLWIYTPRAHANGMVEQVIQGALAFPHKMAPETTRRWIDAGLAYDTADRLSLITAPTLVLAGGVDRLIAPYLSRVVADGIPGARSGPRRVTGLLSRSRRSSTPGSTPSGARLKSRAELGWRRSLTGRLATST